MKKFTLLLVSIAFTCFSYAQSPFGTKQSISTSTGTYPKVIESGKINNDAYADIVIGTFVGGTLEWYKNNGNGTFTLQTLISSTLPRVNGLAIADLDNDNDNDIVATSYSNGQVVWFKNNGNGSFGSAQVIASGLTSANTVKTGDIDGNSTMDVAVSAYGTNSVSWFSNSGSGTFGSAQTISGISNSGPLDFDLADYDQDNDLDVVVAYGLIDAIILFDNALTQSGSPTFGTYALVDSANYGLMDVHFGDVDNNGDLEIVKADQYANTAWYNKSGGSFTKTSFSTSNSSASAVGVADIDGDNRKGVIVGYSSTASTDKVTWYKNSSTSGEITIDNSQNDIYGFTLNDFDNDGKIDMASVSSSQNHLNWFKNISTGGGTCGDSDGDGICDSVDQCPGFDDRIDANGNGVPDGCESTGCTQNTINFSVNTLTNSFTRSISTTLMLPTNSENISFTISDIDEKSKGKASSLFNDNVVVTYKDGLGITKTYGTFKGSDVNSVSIVINGIVQSITVSLNDLLGSTTVSINLSEVTYCGTAIPPCTDSDSDGICDSVDQCPGFDDNIDTNGNGIPDGCESTSCIESTAYFSKDPLIHSGSGSNSTTLNLPTNSQDAFFSIIGLDAKTKGKAGSLYIETVVVSYVDGLGVSKQYGTYNGSNVSSASISITGKVKSITVSLSNFSGSTSSTMSVDLSVITFCVSSSSSSSSTANSSTKEVNSQQVNSSEPLETAFKIYPNPASSKLYVKSFEQNDAEANITLYNINGMQVRNYNISDRYNQVNELDINGLPTGLYIMRISGVKGNLLKTERIIIK